MVFLGLSVGLPGPIEAQHREEVSIEIPDSADTLVPPADTTGSPQECPMCIERRPFVAAVEVVGINIMGNAVARLQNANSVVGPGSWSRNLSNGFEWDTDRFYTNFLEHPIAGTGFYNTARSNGMNFWESAPFVTVGSLMFEYFGEVNRPSANDMFTTTLGGVSLGETLYRVSSLVLDNEDTGISRVFREIGAFVLNPIRGVNRLMFGHMTSVGPNTFDRSPGHLSMNLKVGARRVASGLSLENGVTDDFVGFEMDYGDPLERELKKPFRVFTLDTHLHHSSERVLGGLRVRGNLYGGSLKRARNGRTRHKFMVSLDYEFAENPAYRYAQHSIDVGVVSGWGVSEAWSVRTHVGVEVVPFGAVGNSAFPEAVYDFGFGAGFFLEAHLLHRRSRLLQLAYESAWHHTVNGRYDDRRVQFVVARARFPVFRRLGLGITGILFRSDSYSSTIPNASQRSPQLRVYSSWRLD